jgi:hypothetical protein
MTRFAACVTATFLVCALLGGIRLARAASPVRESLAGLIPGTSTLADAVRLYGAYDAVVPGEVTAYAGGTAATRGFTWAPGTTIGGTRLVVETPGKGTTVTAVMLAFDLRWSTGRGLRVFMPEREVAARYGAPTFACELHDTGFRMRELHYPALGLLVGLAWSPGRSGWCVSHLIAAPPDTLLVGAAYRARLAFTGTVVEDITNAYRAWAREAAAAP